MSATSAAGSSMLDSGDVVAANDQLHPQLVALIAKALRGES